MQMKKPEPSLTITSKKSAEPLDDNLVLDLPVMSDEACRLMEHEAPSFEQQMAHAAMLRRWRMMQSLPIPHPPRNPDRFTL